MQHPTQFPSTSHSINDDDNMLSSNQSAFNTNCCYAIVRNIPQSFHSKHLRRYFSSFVETGRFDCFHFRHRPEIHVCSNIIVLCIELCYFSSYFQFNQTLFVRLYY